MFNKKRYVLLIVITLICLPFMMSTALIQAQGEVVFQIPEKVTVNSSDISLASLVEINAEGDMDKIFSRLEEEISLDFRYSFTTNLSSSYLHQLFEQLEIEQPYVLDLPDGGVDVRLESEKIPYSELISSYQEQIADEMKIEPENIAIEPVIEPDTNYPVEGEFVLPRIDPSLIPGTVNTRIQVYFEGEEWDEIFLPLEIDYYRKVYIAEREILPGESLNREDFRQEKSEESFNGRGEPITSWADQLESEKIAQTRIREGRILSSAHFGSGVEKTSNHEDNSDNQSNENVVWWNDQLTARVEIGSILITTKVEAQEAGAIGEIIEVENLESGEILEARIESAEEVVIE